MTIIKDKTNILYLNDKFTIGGVPTMMKRLIEEYHPDDLNVYYCYLRTPFKIKGLVKNKSANVTYLKSKSKFSLKPFFKILKLIKAHNIDIVHANGDKSSYFLPFFKLFYPSLKLIHHEHHSILVDNKFYSFFLFMTKSLVDCYIAVSGVVKSQLHNKAKIPFSKIILLHNFCSQNQKIKKFIRKKPNIIGFVGRLERLKGCEHLIKAFTLVKHENTDLKLIIAGDGSLKQELQQQVQQLNLNDSVIFKGFVNNPQKIYHDIDLLIIPSISETFSLTLIEAWSNSVPVIASDIPVFKELIKNKKTGMLFKCKDYQDLAAKINSLLNNFLLRKIISKNCLQESSRYSFTKFCLKLSKIYTKI